MRRRQSTGALALAFVWLSAAPALALEVSAGTNPGQIA